MPANEFEFQWSPGSQWLVVEEPDEQLVLALHACAEMTLKAMREPSKLARQGYETAARFYAMSARRDDA